MSVPLRAVFFDFAGTLFSDRALREVHLAQLKFVADEVGVPASDSELRAAYRQGMGIAFRAIGQQRSYLHRDLFGGAFSAMAEALGGKLDQGQVQAAVDRQYRATIAGARLRPDALDTLHALRGRGLHVQLVSNIDQEQLEGLLDQLGLRSALDAWTSSEEAGSCKPDADIYRWALAKAGCVPPEVLFVGDSISHDVEGPRVLGMRTAWLTADAKPGHAEGSPDFIVERLGDVAEIVAEIMTGEWVP